MSTHAFFCVRSAAACVPSSPSSSSCAGCGRAVLRSPGVTAPQCDGQCPLGQMCADSGGTCECVHGRRLRQSRQPERAAGLLGRVPVGDDGVRDVRGRLHVRARSDPLRQRHVRARRGLRGRQHHRRRRLRFQLHADRRAATASRPPAKNATAATTPRAWPGVSRTAPVPPCRRRRARSDASSRSARRAGSS